MEQLPAYALTTLQRVKDRLSIKDDAFDGLLKRYITQVSDFIQNRCDRNFLRQTYTNQEYSVYGNSDYLLLNQSPVFCLTLTGATTLGSTSITGCSSIAGISAGMPVIGEGIAPGTVVVSAATTTIVISIAATGTYAAASLKVSGLIKMQYRAGLPSQPNWTDYTQDQFELLEDGVSGIIRAYGQIALSTMRNNSVRVTYIAGYLIDWENVGSATHTLPSDLTWCAENLVVRAFKRRDVAGKTSEGLSGATVSWNKELDPEDQETIQQYTRLPKFF